MSSTQPPPYPAGICRYRIVGVLGEGGIGTVHEAVQDLPDQATRSHHQVMQWLVSLYDQWGKAEQAAVWKQRLRES